MSHSSSCAGLQHIDANQSVVLTGDGGNEPSDGAIVSVSTVTLTKLSIPWGPDSQGCPDPVPSYAGGVLSHVVLRAPTTTGTHTFAVQWTRSLTPEGVNDANAFGRTPTSIAFSVRVVAGPTPVPNTPPVLTVPGVLRGRGRCHWQLALHLDRFGDRRRGRARSDADVQPRRGHGAPSRHHDDHMHGPGLSRCD